MSSENEQSGDLLLFDLANYVAFNEELHGVETLRLPQQSSSSLQTSSDLVSRSVIGSYSSSANVVKNSLRERGATIAFKTKSEREILDDGYKWRKYGKKMVKNSPHPRNYYRCLSEGCNIKKRVEREQEDPSYVITTYVGVHNHHPLFPATTGHPHAPDSPKFSRLNKQDLQRQLEVHQLGSMRTAVVCTGTD